jgi:hypothetical protein
MKKSKYLGTHSGTWECTHVGIADVQPAYCRRKVAADGKKVRTKSHGSMQYYYIYERPTSDNLAMKMVRLNASQANKVLNGKATVEYYADKKKAKREQAFKDKVSYSYPR